MRLFVALWPSEEVLDALGEAVRRGRRHEPRLRWTHSAEWHLTLVFLGDVGEDQVPALTDALHRALDGHTAPELTLDGWGTFPDRGADASVFWAGVDGTLDGVVDDLTSAARTSGVPVGSRPFVPHLTLARARPPRPPGDILRALGDLPRIGWRADRVDLVESRPARADRYRTARTWRLPWGGDSQRASERGTP
ncbi:RNA 2',3'-cyclic phosphodiesterase [Nocardiopsis sp. MG754419]|uniref:RNA 2',3'-cyclic phosphodiesterase n=1 Tax=Nocardiopsis sp. MG754419 TaxID=2259865 RepID=UPI001BA4634E|nr:RNA 2',3'-cyclic phosphodiesterase [Nocardiopsis sp. MG754419]MBR8742703.1 RNA 2',3'-cyclic phosphodiesterase [Nocardiopsis sp. MG754419]